MKHTNRAGEFRSFRSFDQAPNPYAAHKGICGCGAETSSCIYRICLSRLSYAGSFGERFMTVIIRWRWFRSYRDITRLQALRELLFTQESA
jgi:hypothetical protein